MDAPLFSIGITTYDRVEMLRECLRSILEQGEGSLEIIVGNDHQARPLTLEQIGIDDPRIRLVNHPVNLGELANLNSLLRAASGRYFSWQADDDFYRADYLPAMRAAIAEFPRAEAFFCGFSPYRGERLAATSSSAAALPREMTGAEFFRFYWREGFRTMPLTAMYRREALLELGGLTSLCDAPVAAMSEELLLVQAAGLGRVAVIPAPLVYYRIHEGSWSMTSVDVATWQDASKAFIRAALTSARGDAYREHRDIFLRAILQRAFWSVRSILQRPGAVFVPHREWRFYLESVRTAFELAPGRRPSSALVILYVALRFPPFMWRAMLRSGMRVLRTRPGAEEKTDPAKH